MAGFIDTRDTLDKYDERRSSADNAVNRVQLFTQ